MVRFECYHQEDVIDSYNGILLSHKRNEIMPFAATWMDLETVILSEVSQTEKEKYHDIPYVWNLKGNDTNELTVARGCGGGQGEGIARGFGISIYTLLLKCITTKDLLYITWTLLSVTWQPGWEGSLGKNGYMYMYG